MPAALGTRSGDPADVGRLLVAAAHNQALVDRKAGRSAEAAALVAAGGPRFPADPQIQVMAAESALLDGKDPQAALGILGRTTVPENNTGSASGTAC